jgi:hypothetical protein
LCAYNQVFMVHSLRDKEKLSVSLLDFRA